MCLPSWILVYLITYLLFENFQSEKFNLVINMISSFIISFNLPQYKIMLLGIKNLIIKAQIYINLNYKKFTGKVHE